MAFVALVCLVFYFASEARDQRLRAMRAEARLELIVSRVRALQTQAVLYEISRTVNDLEHESADLKRRRDWR